MAPFDPELSRVKAGFLLYVNGWKRAFFWGGLASGRAWTRVGRFGAWGSGGLAWHGVKGKGVSCVPLFV